MANGQMLTVTELSQFSSLLNKVVQQYNYTLGLEKFYILTHDPIALAGGVGTSTLNDNVITQGLNVDFVITDLTKFSDNDFTWNFRVIGASEYFFSKQVRASAMFLGTLPYHLTRPITIHTGSGVSFDLTNENAGTNNLQIAFIGYKVYSSAAAQQNSQQ